MTNAFRRRLEQLYARWKWALSFRKTRWGLNDYPIVIREQKTPPGQTSARERLPRFVASILNWHLVGVGETRDEAKFNLAVNFQNNLLARKQEGTPPPRPGVDVPLEFASQDRINAHSELANDFIRRVLDVEGAWISDESSLWEFHSDETNEKFFARIQESYGVDVSDIESGNLADILDSVANRREDPNI